MDIYEVVKKLVGPIDPVGESHTDAKRLENIKMFTDLFWKMLCDLSHVAQNEDRHVGDQFCGVWRECQAAA